MGGFALRKQMIVRMWSLYLPVCESPQNHARATMPWRGGAATLRRDAGATTVRPSFHLLLAPMS